MVAAGMRMPRCDADVGSGSRAAPPATYSARQDYLIISKRTRGPVVGGERDRLSEERARLAS